MEQIFHGDWTCLDDMLRDFQIDKSAVRGCKILYAWYEYEDYSGSAFVLFRKGRKLYEVNGSHCSCYGLEDQWDPEVTSREALLKRQHYGVDAEKIRGLVALLKP